MNGKQFTLNSDLIETIEETPDTVLTLTTGKKIIVKESRQKVKNLVKLYRKEIFSIPLD
jgi:flagellar protein FlbD